MPVSVANATTWNVQAFAAADIMASRLVLITTGVLTGTFTIHVWRVHISLSRYRLKNGYPDTRVPVDRHTRNDLCLKMHNSNHRKLTETPKLANATLPYQMMISLLFGL